VGTEPGGDRSTAGVLGEGGHGVGANGEAAEGGLQRQGAGIAEAVGGCALVVDDGSALAPAGFSARTERHLWSAPTRERTLRIGCSGGIGLAGVGVAAEAVAVDDPVAHLLRRITFVAPPAAVASARTMGQAAVIEAALAGRPYPGADQGVPLGVVDPQGRPFYVTHPQSGTPTHGVISVADAQAVAAAAAAMRDPAAAKSAQVQNRLHKYAVDDTALAAVFGVTPPAGRGAAVGAGVGGTGPDAAATAAAKLLGSRRTQVFDPAVNLVAAQMWWTDRMVRTAWPLQELMVLFWHGHFATANNKVDSPALMLRQNQLFRRYALGNFRDLMQAVAVDAAMLIWLDGNSSHKQAPNENFGREFMELFTLGLGYTQDDVEAASRAFTGWHVDGKTDQVAFNPKDHDDGQKTFFGQTGPWTGEDVINIALQQPAHGPFLMGQLWRFFVGTPADAAVLGPVVDAYVGSGLSIAAGLHAILTSPAFSAPEAMWALYRSPAEYVVAGMRAFGRPVMDAGPVQAMGQLGQDLLNPPNVGGWPGGANWVNAGTLLGRFNFAEQLAASEPQAALAPWAGMLAKGAVGGAGGALSMGTAGAAGTIGTAGALGSAGTTVAAGAMGAPGAMGTPADAAGQVVDALIARAGLHGVWPQARQALVAYAQAPEAKVRTVPERISGLIHLVVSAPEFQLK